jgi:ATP-dependent DNA helicase RecQ
MKHFNELKKQHIARIEQLTAFLEEQHICRQNMILSYFGEEVKAPCGQCDNCIRQTTRVACSDIKLLIFEQIQLHRPTVMQLVSLLKHLDRDDVLANIRSAIDNAEITIGPQKRLQLKH